MDTQKASRARINMIGLIMNGKKLMCFSKLKSGARMPLVISHLSTPCVAANDTGYEAALARMAAIDPLAGSPDGLVG